MWPPPLRLFVRVVACVLAAVVGAVALYVLAGLVGGSIPVNAGWREPARGVTIWVEDNGVHTALILPKIAAGVDWRGDFPATDLADPRYAAYDHVAVGWGERGFFLGTPTWADVRPGTILAAAAGSDRTLLHVEHVPQPVFGGRARALRLTPVEYRRVVRQIRAVRAAGTAIRGYGANDVFYPARGHSDAVRTCNTWTGRTLAAAGVRVGVWTPFAITVMRWF